MQRLEPAPRPWTLTLATGNPHKVRELEAILKTALPPGSPLRLLTPADFPDIVEPEETGSTFLENALIKAHYWARNAGTLALADDSGLVIDALDGRPGIHSARYADSPARRIGRVLTEMQEMAGSARHARFVCVMALADPYGLAVSRDGRIEGEIIREPRGAAGFGYDPIFRPTALDPHGDPGNVAGLTFAEYDDEAKNKVSHRGRALSEILPHLTASLREGRVVDVI